MTWFKVDDGLFLHHKIVKAGNAAMGLWVRAGSWSAHHLTDGFIPDAVIEILGTPSQRAKLIKAGLWIEGVGGCQFHEWSENGRQPTGQNVRESRAAAAARKAKSRGKSSENQEISAELQVKAGGHADVTRPGHTPVTAPRPDPTRPEEETTTSVTAAAATQTDPDVQMALDVGVGSTDQDELAAPASSEDAEFETWWLAWPRKVAKVKARSSYHAARKKKISAEQLLKAAQDQVAAWVAAGKQPEFIPHATTWLNQERYNDVVERPSFTVITNPRSPWYGQRIDSKPNRSPWAEDMGQTS